MGAVITRKDVADSFSNGMEFFSTFGGSTVSCAAGKAVLEVMEAENLPNRAAQSGAMLLEGLTSLFAHTPLNVDVRGLGLFLGIEVCHEDGTPATELVGDLVNAMRQRRVLMGLMVLTIVSLKSVRPFALMRRMLPFSLRRWMTA